MLVLWLSWALAAELYHCYDQIIAIFPECTSVSIKSTINYKQHLTLWIWIWLKYFSETKTKVKGFFKQFFVYKFLSFFHVEKQK